MSDLTTKLLKKMQGKAAGSSAAKKDLTTELLRKFYLAQWQRSRIARTKKEELLVEDEPELFKVAGRLAENYLKILKELGQDIDLKEFTIDKTGFSPEIADKLGQHYLDNNLIILVPEQELLPVVRRDCSFLEELVDRTFSQAESIVNTVTLKEGLYGRFETNLPSFLLGQAGVLTANAAFDTLNNSVKRIQKLKKDVARMGEKPDLLLDDEYVKKAIEESMVLGQTYPLENVELPDVFPIKASIRSFKLSAKETDIYCLWQKEPLFIYFNKNGERIDIANGRFLDGADTKKLIDTLYDLGYLDFSPETVKKRMLELAVDKLGDLGSSENLVNYLHSAEEGELPERFYQYKALLDDIEKKAGAFYRIPTELKARLVSPRGNNQLVMEVIARSCNDLLMMYQHNEDGFKELFTKADKASQEARLDMIMTETKFEDQHNPRINHWLRKNYADLCQEKGVVFVKRERKAAVTEIESKETGSDNPEPQPSAAAVSSPEVLPEPAAPVAVLPSNIAVVTYKGLEFEQQAYHEQGQKKKKLLTFDESLARLQRAGFERHARPQEVFGLLIDSLEGRLAAPEKAMADDAFSGYGEWLSLAFKRQGNVLIAYFDPKGPVLEWFKGYANTKNFTWARKEEFDIKGKPSQSWIDLDEFDYRFVQYIYGRSFSSLPTEMQQGNKKAQVRLPPDGIAWPVGRGGYGGCSVDGYDPVWASRGARHKRWKLRDPVVTHAMESVAEQPAKSLEGIVLHEAKFDECKEWAGLDDGVIIRSGTKFVAHHEDNRKRLLYDGNCFKWCDCGDGIVIRTGDDNDVLVCKDGKIKKLCEDNDIYSKWDVVRNRVVIATRIFSWFSENGYELNTCDENGDKKTLYNGALDKFVAYQNGAIVQDGKKFFACNKNSKKTLLYKGKFGDWKGYENGAIIQKGNKLTAYSEDGQKELYDGDIGDWAAYQHGAIVWTLRKFIACNENGNKTVLYEGPWGDWKPYGNGVIIRTDEIKNAGGEEARYSKFVAFREKDGRPLTPEDLTK